MEHLYAEDHKKPLIEEYRMGGRVKLSSINIVCTEKCNVETVVLLSRK